MNNFWVEDDNGNIVISEQKVAAYADKHQLNDDEAAERLIKRDIARGKLSRKENYHIRDDF